MNKLTKSLAVFTLIAMLFTMFSVVGYAEPTSAALTTSTEEQTTVEPIDEAVIDEEFDEDLPVEHDFSLRVSTRVNLIAYVHHVTPNVTLTFTNKDTGEAKDIILNEGNFISKTESFKLPIDFAPSDKDTEFILSMKTEDPFLTGVCYESGNKEVAYANGAGIPVTITKNGISLALTCNIKTKYIVNTMDTNKNPIPNIKLRVFNKGTREYREVTTDSNGTIVMDTNDISGSLTFICLTSGYSIGTDNSTVYNVEPNLIPSTLPVIDIKLTSTRDEGNPEYSPLIVNIKNSGMFLFEPTDIALTLENINHSADTENEESIYPFTNLTLGENTVDVPKGSYKVITSSETVTIAAPETISADSTLNLTVAPRATLKVFNSKEDCVFRIVNIDGFKDKTFEGVKEFGAILDQTIMVENLNSNSTYTVSIDDEGVTELDLASGVVTGSTGTSNKTNPQTSDYVSSLIGLIVFLVIVLAVLIVLYLKYNGKLKFKNGKTTHMLSLLLVGVMMLSIASTPLSAFASTTGTNSRPGAGGSMSGTTGNLQAYNNTGVGYSTMIKISLVPNSGYELLTESAEEWQLASRDKFKYQETELYLPPDVLTYNRWLKGGDIVTVWDDDKGVTGTDVTLGKVWWNRTREMNVEEKEARTLPIARSEEDVEGWSEDFMRVLLPFFKGRNFTTDIGTPLNGYMYERLNLNNENPDKQAETDAFVKSYLDYLENRVKRVGEDPIDTKKYKVAYAEGNLSILVECMIGNYIMNGDQETVFYITTHDAMEVLNYTGKIEYPAREVEAVRAGYDAKKSSWYACNGHDSNEHCIEVGHMPFSISKALIDNYLRVLKPAAQCLPAGDANPFGGWGFFNLGIGSPNQIGETEEPTVYGNIIYKVVDNSGNVTATKTVAVDGYEFENKTLNQLIGITKKTKDMFIPNTVNIDGIDYTAKAGQTVPVTAIVVNQNEEKVSDLSPEMIVSTTPTTGGWDYSVVNSLYPYVRTLASDLVLADGTVHDIKITFEVIVEPISQPANGVDIVPQWRINKYWDSIMTLYPTGTQKSSAVLKLDTLTADEGHEDSYLTSDNGIAMKLNVSDLSQLPFISNAKVDNGVNLNKIRVKHATNPSTSLSVYGDLMAFKNNGVDKLATAKWVSQAATKYGHFSIDASEGSDREQGTEHMTKPCELSFDFEPIKAIIHYRGVRSHSKTGCNCYLVRDTTSYVKVPAKYDLGITFNCYNQTVKTPMTISNTSNSVDGFTEFTNQSDKNIRLYSEVPMLFTDTGHNNSIRFMAADKATEIKPISYHTIAYDTLIKPSLSGVAATDYRAVQTLADLGTPEAQMLLKGSATTTAYDMTGTLTATSYALDVDNNYYKTAWANNDYTAEKTNSEFLKGFANPQADGSYTATIDATENLKIGGQSYGAMKNELTVKSTGTTTDRYELTIRAGEITAINGYLDWATRYPEIADVLINKMKATHSGVFSVFASGEGDVLDEPEFERLAKSLREGSESIKEGIGWYSEDCTTLSLYVYTTKFDLVGTQFSNKVPTSLPDLETPQDKSMFFSRAFDGDLSLDLKVEAIDDRCSAVLSYSTASDKWSDRVYDLYAVGNVGVLDQTY